MRKSLNFAWDNCYGLEIVIRKMIFGDLEDLRWLFTQLGKKELKNIFLDNLHRFRGKERTFWKLVLEVSDAEIEARASQNFRENTRLRYFP